MSQWHDESVTARATETIERYRLVKMVASTDEIINVEKTDSSTDVIFGVAMENAEAGDLVAIRMINSGGLLPSLVTYTSKPGDGLTISTGNPGSLSNNTGSTYLRRVAYVVKCDQDAAGTSPKAAWCLFVRTNYLSS